MYEEKISLNWDFKFTENKFWIGIKSNFPDKTATNIFGVTFKDYLDFEASIRPKISKIFSQ